MFRRTHARLFLWNQNFDDFARAVVGDSDGNFVDGVLHLRSASSSASSSRHIPISNACESHNLNVPALHFASDHLVQQALKCARRAQREFFSATTSSNNKFEARAQILTEMASNLEANLKDVAQAESLNSGVALSDVALSLRHGVEWLRFCANWCLKHNEKITFSKSEQHVHYSLEPRGTVAVLTPAIHSTACALKHIAPALAAGNAVIWKPSENAPLSSVLMASCVFSPAPSLVSVLQGDAAVGQQLAKSPLVHAVAFSSNRSNAASTAKQIKIAAAESNFKPCFCESQDAPLLVIGEGTETTTSVADADNDSTLDRAVDCAMSAFRFSGQSSSLCVRRVLLPERLLDPFLSAVAARLRNGVRWKLGHSLDPLTHQGPFLSAGRCQLFLDAVLRATTHSSKSTGTTADLAFGGFAPKFPGGSFAAPTCLVNVAEDTELWQEWIPGPLLCVNTFSSCSAEELVARCNKSATRRFGGRAFVFSDSPQEVELLSRGLDVGVVFTNTTTGKATAAPQNPLELAHVEMQPRKITGGDSSVFGGEASIRQFMQLRTIL